MTNDEKRDLEIRGDMAEFAARQRSQERAVMLLSVFVLAIAFIVLILVIKTAGGSAENA